MMGRSRPSIDFYPFGFTIIKDTMLRVSNKTYNKTVRVFAHAQVTLHMCTGGVGAGEQVCINVRDLKLAMGWLRF